MHRPVVLKVTSRDVIHSFWAPNLHGKRDLIPGYTTAIWLDADQPGIFRGQCAEFCGLQHAHMAFDVVAEPQADFDRWLEGMRQPARPPQSEAEQHGRDVFMNSRCGACHTVQRHRRTRPGGAGPHPHRDAQHASAPARCPTRASICRPGCAIRRPASRATRCRRIRCPPRICRRCSPTWIRCDDRPRELPHADEDLAMLERTWAEPRGFVGWFTHVDHKSIARRYLVTAFVYFLVGGMLAALMRLQLSRPDNSLIGPDLYNQIFTTHGTTMMFLFAVPVMQALGIYFVPLMVGARSIAFPRLIAFSYWMYLFGGIFLFTSFLLNAGPDVGWFAYPPLSETLFTPSKRADVWAQLITFTEVASLAVGGLVDHDRVQAARAGDDAEPDPAVRLVAGGHLVHGAVRDAGGDAREHRADPRPSGQHALLRRRACRRRAALAAPVLVLRPPRGLHHLHPGQRPGVGDRHHIFAPAHVRLPRGRARAGVDGVHGLRPVGPPHVRDRPAAAGRELLHRRQHHDRHPDRRPDLLLDRDDVVGPGRRSRRRCCGSSASSPSSSAAG